MEPTNRIGPKYDAKGCPRKRAVIVRFRREAVRDEVRRARIHLKEYNRTRINRQVFRNEDLTVKLAKLAFLTGHIKREKKVSDCLVACGLRPHDKTIKGTVNEVLTENDLVL